MPGLAALDSVRRASSERVCLVFFFSQIGGCPFNVNENDIFAMITPGPSRTIFRHDRKTRLLPSMAHLAVVVDRGWARFAIAALSGRHARVLR
jgi:hypothetical protein